MHTPSKTMLKAQVKKLQESLPVALVNRFVEADLMTQAASLSFYALLSLAPLLVLLLWLTASLYPEAQDALVAQIGDLLGNGAHDVADTVIKNAEQRPSVGSLAGIWSTLLLFVGATAVFAQLQGALNLIFRTDAKKLEGIVAWLRKRVFSFGVVFAIGFLLIVSMTLTTALQVMFANVPSMVPVLGTALSLAIYALAFAFLYHYMPDRRVAWKQALVGGLITSALFAVGRYAIGLYISTASPGSAYGSMSALVILLVWLYYATVVFFIGALLTSVVDERYTRLHKLASAELDAGVPDPGKPPLGVVAGTYAAVTPTGGAMPSHGVDAPTVVPPKT